MGPQVLLASTGFCGSEAKFSSHLHELVAKDAIPSSDSPDSNRCHAPFKPSCLCWCTGPCQSRAFIRSFDLPGLFRPSLSDSFHASHQETQETPTARRTVRSRGPRVWPMAGHFPWRRGFRLGARLVERVLWFSWVQSYGVLLPFPCSFWASAWHSDWQCVWFHFKPAHANPKKAKKG